jgi:hypothetical protein
MEMPLGPLLDAEYVSAKKFKVSTEDEKQKRKRRAGSAEPSRKKRRSQV